jgi:hypothetical protein
MVKETLLKMYVDANSEAVRPIDYLYGLAVVAIVILTAMLEGGMC